MTEAKRTTDMAGFDPQRLRGATLYFDCYAGIAGDMTLGALLDLGVPESVVREPLARLAMQDWSLQVHKVRRGVMMATKVDVLGGEDAPHQPHPGHSHTHSHPHSQAAAGTVTAQFHRVQAESGKSKAAAALHSHPHPHPHGLHDHHSHHDLHAPKPPAPELHQHQASTELHAAHGGHPHVHYAQIRALILDAGLEPDITARALRMFDRLAEVEGAIHGVSVAEVSFHEVGAVDSIVDIVGTAAALSWLAPKRIVSRAVAVGSGMVRTAHGLLPVPAPATAALLAGAQVEGGGPPFELTTPTGALILASFASGYGAMPSMQVLALGYGAGTRELPDRPNLLRVIAGIEPAASAPAPSPDLGPATGERCVVIEANIDDMNPQLFEPLLHGLLQAGARDVWLTPVQMKKGRPGTVLSVLCDPGLAGALTRQLLRESTSLGVRSYEVTRTMLDREIREVSTEFGGVQVKLGRDPQTQQLWNVAPEFASVQKQALAHSVPLKTVYAAALAAASKLT